MAMPLGPPPGQPEAAEAMGMSPEQAQQVLAKFGIQPQDLPMVTAACEAMSGGGQPAPQDGGGQGLMAALKQPYRQA